MEAETSQDEEFYEERALGEKSRAKKSHNREQRFLINHPEHLGSTFKIQSSFSLIKCGHISL